MKNKSISIRILLACILFNSISGNYSFSQENSRRYINLGGGYAFIGLRDQGITPLYYSGNHGLVNAGYQNTTDSRKKFLEVIFLVGNITPAIYPELTPAKIKNIKSVINYSHHEYAGKILNDRYDLHIGGTWDTQLSNLNHNQFVNSSITTIFNSTINISGSITYPLTIDERQFSIVLRSDLPVLAFIVRPGHAYIKPEGFLRHDHSNIRSIIESIEVSTINRFSGLKTDLSLEYQLKNKNALRIGYKWEYFIHRDVNLLETASHGITIQTLFNF